MSGLTRRSVVLAGVLAPLGAPARVCAQAQSWPSGPIRIIVPFPPGGSVDAVARLAQAGLGQRLGVTVLVENRSGASGSTGSAAVAKSPPDGNTWLIVFDTHAVNPSLLPNLAFDNDKDLDPVSLIASAPYVVARHPSRSAHELGELIRAQPRRSPEHQLPSVGSGSIGHLALELFGKQAGIELIHVPYRGGGLALNDRVAAMAGSDHRQRGPALPQIQAGAIRALLQLGKTRLRALPEIPTIAEGGYPGAQASSWWGIFAPAGTPKPIIERFRTALVESLREERVAKQLTETQQMTLVLSGPEELRSFAAEQARIWGAVVRDNNIKADE